ncbi:hypothetical protein [Tengunoibacter tsumagoiensis]|uniref:Chromosome partition protein Smc n=1 Tax=Tengunoibacter tsumagoiensis TaxID=2014871 RepID=A0A401ZX55_9CHLR|nr:hypothetical protein [Tengunoibacter tsumagoiensis]GCE11428.1 hypothetical protein KTT_12870 [Tengunoibacter tsumagoiensis]
MQKISQLVRQLPGRLPLASMLTAVSLTAVLSGAALAAPQDTKPNQSCGAKDVQCVITFADQRIQERQDALVKLSTKVTDLQQKHHISDTEADNLQGNIKADKDGLNDLKTKIDATTDAKTAREEAKTIYTQFRIFAVVIPRDTKRLHLDVELQLRDTLEDLKSKLESTLDKVPADKQDQAKQDFTDYKSNLTEAEAQIDVAQTAIAQLTVDNYNNHRDVYETNLKTLDQAETTIHKDLHAAAKDLHEINKLAKKK